MQAGAYHQELFATIYTVLLFLHLQYIQGSSGVIFIKDIRFQLLFKCELSWNVRIE
jgi:hypothetical protein